MNRLLAALLALALLPAPAFADVYRWADEKGDVHYTDNPDDIPASRRKAAVKTEGGSLGYVKAEKSAPKEPPRAPNKADGEPAPDASTREDGDARERAAEEEEARREKQWRGRFRDMHSRIDRLQRMIDADKKALADPVNSGIPVLYDARGAIVPNPEFEAIRRRIPEQEAQLRQAKDELADLEREASRNAVPQIWRH